MDPSGAWTIASIHSQEQESRIRHAIAENDKIDEAWVGAIPTMESSPGKAWRWYDGTRWDFNSYLFNVPYDTDTPGTSSYDNYAPKAGCVGGIYIKIQCSDDGKMTAPAFSDPACEVPDTTGFFAPSSFLGLCHEAGDGMFVKDSCDMATREMHRGTYTTPMCTGMLTSSYEIPPYCVCAAPPSDGGPNDHMPYNTESPASNSVDNYSPNAKDNGMGGMLGHGIVLTEAGSTRDHVWNVSVDEEKYGVVCQRIAGCCFEKKKHADGFSDTYLGGHGGEKPQAECPIGVFRDCGFEPSDPNCDGETDTLFEMMWEPRSCYDVFGSDFHEMLEEKKEEDPKPCFNVGWTVNGTEIATHATVNAVECLDKCRDIEPCMGYTWDSQSSLCTHFESVTGDPYEKENMTAGPKDCEPCECFYDGYVINGTLMGAPMYTWDYISYDNQTKASFCLAACKKNQTCEGYMWNNLTEECLFYSDISGHWEDSGYVAGLRDCGTLTHIF